MANPSLSPAVQKDLISALMAARRAVRAAKAKQDSAAEAVAHAEVGQAKRSLGERGPVWWDDGAPDYNRHMARNTPYRDWFATLA